MIIKRTLIIAEAGVNHNGDIGIAKSLISVAADAGADIVKFQTFKADKLASKVAKKATYQDRSIKDGDDSQHAMLRKLEMPDEWHFELVRYASSVGIQFLSTGFDEESIDFLDQFKMPFYKIPSGEITNKPYLEHIARKGKPIIMSTGMADMQEIESAIQVIESQGLLRKKITILHCNSEYPTPMSDVNLLAMSAIGKALDVEIGYSDHTLGIEVSIAATALGAKVIEKHFTLSRSLPGPDHSASLEPSELKAMVVAIRNIESAISGSGNKNPTQSELKNKLIGRKSIHFATDLPEGTIICAKDLKMMRPGLGISPMQVDHFFEKKLRVSVDKDQMLTQADFFD